MPESKIIGYKKIFGFVMPDWVNEETVKNLVIGLLSMAVMLMVLIFVVWPNLEVVKSREADLKSSKASLEVLKMSKAGVDRLATDLSDTDQQRILLAIPQQYSPDGAIYNLRRISAETGVSIVSYTLPSGVILDTMDTPISGPETDMVSFVAFPVKLMVAAPVESLLKFVAMLEASLPVGTVSDLNLQEVSKLSRTAGDKTVQMAMEIKYYEATLRRVNINKVKAFTENDLKLANSLRDYSLFSVSGSAVGEETVSSTTGSGSIFGF
ncbi:TPA: hypothetical protein DIU27_02135 [Candidatus Collierbacteria bacterium]|uniref:Uncharacterized protein n=1 Tax=Candidatus Collierbacteria bacterium GW2011_GWB2_44_22 TaxID=1618387 RepID=A0A0G1K6P4_9BACT|nr:MAG: hypothetical protein UW31_C0009G0025 [Candidatus Collierbacteria bacterium GW2011_GWA2_44_13]KKT51545.1 MAG: hypothetical protein UW42_C0001G0020 [Candidatus Collierbacteria bacterium GW2011_GWB1_44_197]KKT52002.1 MAG: hypothetical protein UW44_C0005G0044 [Candidatus Collierbacteria bacterium GW2011_GWB2_44_22]KKT62140.1 MAG: hypothetical protein UW56_C0011G0025 [Candidatus Collierbacteria bacterium GW2011_GWD1_44_27]KKT66710.1 MAG: hypothetical protein UW58_C0004G0059 [Candidatus Colli